MVNIAYSDCSANGNSGLRQVLLFFLEYFGSYEENQGECSFDKPLGGPKGAPKVPPRPYAEKNFVFKSGVQTTQNALIIHWKSIRGSAHRTNPKGGPQGALKVPLGPYREEH